MLELLLLATALATKPAPATSGGHYLLAATLKDGDRVVASPVLTIAADTAARIQINDNPNERYDLSLVATPTRDGSISVHWKIHARSSFGDREAAPILLVRSGQRSAIEFGEQSKTARPFRVEFSLTTSPS